MSLLLLERHLLLLVQDALLDDGIHLLNRCTWIVGQQDLLLSLNPLLLLLAQILHLLQLLQSLFDLFVSARLFCCGFYLAQPGATLLRGINGSHC